MLCANATSVATAWGLQRAQRAKWCAWLEGMMSSSRVKARATVAATLLASQVAKWILGR